MLAPSTWSIRNDWNPAHPASAVDNLVNGKFRLLDEYKNYGGVYVESETLRYPFIGLTRPDQTTTIRT